MPGDKCIALYRIALWEDGHDEELENYVTLGQLCKDAGFAWTPIINFCYLEVCRVAMLSGDPIVVLLRADPCTGLQNALARNLGGGSWLGEEVRQLLSNTAVRCRMEVFDLGWRMWLSFSGSGKGQGAMVDRRMVLACICAA